MQIDPNVSRTLEIVSGVMGVVASEINYFEIHVFFSARNIDCTSTILFEHPNK